MFIPIQGLCQSNISQIIDIGKLAPSSHNAQMWNPVITSDTSFSVSIDFSRILKEVDPDNREAWISIGAFIENCMMAAHDMAYQARVNLCSGFVNFNLGEKLTEENIVNIPHIRLRKTSRLPFSKKNIASSYIDSITKSTSDLLYFSLDTPEGKSIAQMIYNANVLQCNDSAKMSELSNWVITSRKEQKQRKDGLSPNKLGMSKMQSFFFLSFFNKKSIQKSLFKKLTLKSSKKQIDNCAGFFLILSDSNDWVDNFNSGRNLERLWIDFTKNGIAVHPMSQPIEETIIYNQLKQYLGIKSKEVQMILRLGYAEN